EEGDLEGWGKLIDIPEKKNRYGLGYQPSAAVFSIFGHGKIPTIQETFRNAGFIHEGQVALLEDTDEAIPNLVYRCTPDEALDNWKAMEIPEIVSFSK
ncbi:gag-pol polyprotein, partial [Trifolium medium]|nr:gag-pol polyprotein [Trifolium medium]